MFKSRLLWKMGIVCLAIVLLLWGLKAGDVISATGVVYSVLHPIAAILLMVTAYLIVVGAVQVLLRQNKAWRPAAPLLTGVWAYLLLAPLAVIAQYLDYFPPETATMTLWTMAGIAVWVILMWLFNFILTRIVPSINFNLSQCVTAVWGSLLLIGASYLLESVKLAPKNTGWSVALFFILFAVWLVTVYGGYFITSSLAAREAIRPGRDRLITTIWSIIILIFLWEVWVKVAEIPQFLVPSPSATWKEMISKAHLLGSHINTTLLETILGYLLGIVVGILSAILIVWYKFLEDVLYPLLVILQIVPKIAIAPLLLIWVGYGATSKVLIAFLIGYFPIVVSMITGLRLVEPELLDLVRSFRATKWQVLSKIRFPNSLPFLFNGLQISITLAVIGAIVGEFVGGSKGLGYLIIVSNYELNTPLMFTALFILSVIGLVLFGLIVRLEKIMIPWAIEEQEMPVVGGG
ncbi:MAG: ABC transporter permease [Candidatus Tectomicrobia bacterium]|nr:ABC transporter permease [Candidatus Tectomicrobia bacterium]